MIFCRLSINDSKELVREAGERKTRFRALHASVEPRLSPSSDVHCLVDRRMMCPAAFLKTGKESKSCGQSQCCPVTSTRTRCSMKFHRAGNGDSGLSGNRKPKMVTLQRCNHPAKVGQKRRNVGRLLISVGSGPVGLRSIPTSFHQVDDGGPSGALVPADRRYVCRTLEHQVSAILQPMASEGSAPSGRAAMPLSRSDLGICPSPLVSGTTMARAPPRQPPRNLPNRYASLGFDVLVAPRHQPANKREPSVLDQGEVGVVRGLPREAVEAAKNARSLHVVVGERLRARSLPQNQVETHLKTIEQKAKNYQSAFAAFYGLAAQRELDLAPSDDQVVGVLLELNDFSESIAKNAFAGLCLIPGYQQLRFNPLLREVKTKWNTSTPRL